MKTGSLLIALFLASPFLWSCEKDPEIIIQKETVYDTLVILDTVTLIETVFETLPDTATTFILLRHAETTGGGSNPLLSVAGQARAQELSRIMEHVDIDAIYSTNFNRTLQTVEPVAAAQGLTPVIYDPFAPAALLTGTLEAYPKGVVLVVGHSNTIPALLNEMVGSNTYPDLPESEYDNLFLVYVPRQGEATVVRMKYGA